MIAGWAIGREGSDGDLDAGALGTFASVEYRTKTLPSTASGRALPGQCPGTHAPRPIRNFGSAACPTRAQLLSQRPPIGRTYFARARARTLTSRSPILRPPGTLGAEIEALSIWGRTLSDLGILRRDFRRWWLPSRIDPGVDPFDVSFFPDRVVTQSVVFYAAGT